MDKFFKAITDTAVSDEEAAIEILKARGFLIEEDHGDYYLSDNASENDFKYLNQILMEFQMGFLKESQLVFTEQCLREAAQKAFVSKKRIGFETVHVHHPYSYSFRRIHGHKTDVRILEPFAARLVKALSACGVITAMSCDGNHFGADGMFFAPAGRGDALWQKLILGEFVRDRFDLDWDKDFVSCAFSEESQADTYLEVNRLAEFLYENRILLRGIKQMGHDGFTPSYYRHSSDREIERAFEKKVLETFAELRGSSLRGSL